ncbi:MAG: hypothetical protein QNK05_04240 [Myxococcota bacterium]|nr:hypothetical protein [Myxococcota bacterium]
MRWTLPIVVAVAAAGIGIALGSLGAAAESPPAEVVESKFELFVHDADASTAFYRLLGFEVAHRQTHGYTTLRSGSTVVALSPLPEWAPIHWLGFLRNPPLGTEIVFYTSDLEGQRQVLLAAGHFPSAIEKQPWGDRDFRVRDPDGYYVRVTEGTAVPGAGPPPGAAAEPSVEIDGAWLEARQGRDESQHTLRVAIWAREVFDDPELPLALSDFEQLDADPELEYVVASRGPGTGPWYRLQILDFRPDGIIALSVPSAGPPRFLEGRIQLGSLPQGYLGAGSEPEYTSFRLTPAGLAPIAEAGP